MAMDRRTQHRPQQQPAPRTMLVSLLNTLEAERHVRAALLVEVVAELGRDPRDRRALRRAQALLDRVEQGAISDAEFADGLHRLRVAALRGRTPESLPLAAALHEDAE